MNQTPSDANGGRLPWNVKILGLASLVNDIASEMVYPYLSYFLIVVLGGGPRFLGLVEGVADSVSSLLRLASGSWSDRASRRRGFVLVGYFLSAFSRPVIAFISVPWQFLAARTSDRVGKGIRSAPRDALIADSTPPDMRGRAFGFHRAMDHLGAAVGPLLGAAFLYLWPGQLRTLFLVTLIPGLAVWALLVFGLKEAKATTTPKEKLELTLRPFDWNFRLYLLALIVFTLGNSSDLFLLERSRELGVEVVLLPVLWSVFHVLKSAGNWLLGKAVDRVGPRPLLLLGWLVYALVYLAFGVATTAWEVWVYFLGYALFYALSEPAEKTLVAQLTGREHRGLAYGWFNFALGIATLPASVLFGLIYEEYGALAAFSWSAALAGFAMLLLLGVRTRPHAVE
jgi:MFS family permease